jgi:predicted RNA-binding protein YlxR (DUF448 family)
MKKIPMRKCIATNVSLPKNDLLRIVRCPDDTVKVDVTGKVNGKGAYLAKTIEALEIVKKKNLLKRYLKVEIEDEIYEEIKSVING